MKALITALLICGLGCSSAKPRVNTEPPPMKTQELAKKESFTGLDAFSLFLVGGIVALTWIQVSK